MKCFWWSQPCIEFVYNFGDLLTPMLLKHYGLMEYIEPTSGAEKADLLVVGSILQGVPSSASPLIMGSGILTDRRLSLPHAKIYALRGLLTKDRLGITTDVTVGDPGLLISEVLPKRHEKESPQHYKPIGIVPHFKHYASPRLDAYRHDARYKFINPRCEPEYVAEEICSCSAIIASSLHALIVADSYGIPNIRLTFQDGLDDVSDYKYLDYYSAIERSGYAARSITPEEINSRLRFDTNYQKNVARVKEALDKEFRRLAEDIKRNAIDTREVREAIDSGDFRKCKTLAERGDADCMNYVGDCYYDGRAADQGVERSPEKAFHWYKKSADNGFIWGFYNVGKCYCEGIGVQQNLGTAREWYKKSADMGNFWAHMRLAELGDADSMNYVGDCYYDGRAADQGVERSPEKAFHWYKKSADNGFTWGFYNVGKCYSEGIGVQQNLRTAREWYRKAADMGNYWAQQRLTELGWD